jgi:hypothetical protein
MLTCNSAQGYIKSEEIYPDEMKPDQKIKDIRAWLKTKGVLDLEPVTLFAEQLEKVRVRIKHCSIRTLTIYHASQPWNC